MNKIRCQNCGEEVYPTPYCGFCGSETGATDEQFKEMVQAVGEGEITKSRQGIHEVLIGREWALCEPVDPLDEQAGFFRLLADTLDGQLKAGSLVRAVPEEIERHWKMTRHLINPE